MKDDEIILQIDRLKKLFPVRRGMFNSRQAWVYAVDEVSLALRTGETLGLVGESGCGKSTLARTVLGLHRPTAGTVRMRGKDLFSGKGRALARREVQMVFQDPYSSLNPRMTMRQIIGEPLVTHTPLRRRALDDRVVELLEVVALNGDYLQRYPHQLSGGQRQRVGIARALALNPALVILDEPTSSLDVSVQAQILNLLVHLQQSLDLTYLFVSHHLSVVRYMSDRVAVMYLGQIVELAPAAEIFQGPLHPYTVGLLASEPRADPGAPFALELLEGDVPSAVNVPAGCRFHTRCARRLPRCSTEVPELREVAAGHLARCFLWG